MWIISDGESRDINAKQRALDRSCFGISDIVEPGTDVMCRRGRKCTVVRAPRAVEADMQQTSARF